MNTREETREKKKEEDSEYERIDEKGKRERNVEDGIVK